MERGKGRAEDTAGGDCMNDKGRKGNERRGEWKKGKWDWEVGDEWREWGGINGDGYA